MRGLRVLFVRAFVAVAMLAALLVAGATPTAAASQPGATEVRAGKSSLTISDRCDIGDFGDTKLIDPNSGYPAHPGVWVGTSAVVPLDYEIPAGRILVSGSMFDEVHFDDVPDFQTTLSQFAERFTVRFLGADGGVVGETDPTPDLPDLAPLADFALPSIDLSGPATSIQLVHAGDGSSPNSVYADCINIDLVGDNPDPRSLVRSALCPLDAFALNPEAFECGFFAVPEERSDPTSRLINIAFALLPGDGTYADPVFYLEGGPGGSPMAFGDFIVEFGLGQAADGRDIVLIDQRGTGYSQPSLVCPFDETIEYGPGEFVQQCVEVLRASGARLSSYTTVENAADIAGLRIALGYDEYNLFGGSYGTDLGLSIMRDHPEGIRSSVLDSVFPPVVNPLVDQGIGYIKMLDSVVARCAADPVCDAGFGDLRPAIIAAFDNMAQEPVVVEGAAANWFTGGPIVIDPFLLSIIINQEQGNETLPALLHGLADPDPAVRTEIATTFTRLRVLAEIEAILADILGPDGPPPADDAPIDAPDARVVVPVGSAIGSQDARWGVPGPGNFFSDGFFLTVICAEESPFISDGGATQPSTEPWTGTVVEVAAGMAFPDSPGSLEQIRNECKILDVLPEDPIVTQPVTSDIPSLVLLTDVDFQTVPEWSRLTAETLPNSFLFEFPNLFHVVTLSDPCPASIVAQFYSSPTVEPDAMCIADLPPIVYSGDPPVDPGPLDDVIAEFEALLEEIFSQPPPGQGPPPGEGPPPEGVPPMEVAAASTVEEIVASVDYDPTTHAAILRLYQAIFDRHPDVAGAKYWIDIANQGYGVLDIAGFMSDSQEWLDKYSGTSDEDFVAIVYSNILGRSYDQLGYEYWLDLLRDPNPQGLARHEMVFYVTANAEFAQMYPFQP